MGKTIKVKVVLSIEVDLDSYRENYGNDSIETIRDDVKRAVLDAVHSGGVLADGIVDAELKS